MKERLLQPELMDDPQLPGDQLASALRGLRRLNAVSFAHQEIWRQVRPVLAARRICTLLDVACASGDLAIDLAHRAIRHGYHLRIIGCDINEASLAMARQQAATRGLSAAEFVRLDVLGQHTLPKADVVTSSLFLHHLPTASIAPLLAALRAAATSRVIVNDLTRSRFNLAMVTVASRVLTRSPIVHVDARLSVRAAFTVDELSELARQAGWTDTKSTFGGFGRVNLVCETASKPTA